MSSAKKLQFSLLGMILAGVFVAAVIVHVSGRNAEAEAVEARNAFAADLQAGNLSTRAVFESRCHPAQKVTETNAGVELHYAVANIYVTFAPLGPPVLESESSYRDEQGMVHSYRAPAEPGLVFDLLGCR
jgi:hypothetical protein